MKNKYVEIYRLQNDGTQKTIVTCRLIDGLVVCEGDSTLVKQLEEDGIADYEAAKPVRLLPTDGIVFLNNLKFAFKSGYLNASDIKE